MLKRPEGLGAWPRTSPPVAADPRRSRRSRPTRPCSPTSTTNCGRRCARETELFFDAIVREDRSIFGFPRRRLHVRQRAAGPALRHRRAFKGDEFRRVSLAGTGRGGVLTQASVLTVTSNPTRTSPVKRGKWILENLWAPPPPPPPGVDEPQGGHGRPAATGHAAAADGTAPDQPGLRRLPRPHGPARLRLRELRRRRRLADRGRQDAIDAVRRAARRPIVPRARPSCVRCSGTGPDDFRRCLAEKMLTYALGRGLDAGRPLRRRRDRPRPAAATVTGSRLWSMASSRATRSRCAVRAPGARQ